MKNKTETVTITEEKIYLSCSEKDNIICLKCYATNTILDKYCKNCGEKLCTQKKQNKK